MTNRDINGYHAHKSEHIYQAKEISVIYLIRFNKNRRFCAILRNILMLVLVLKMKGNGRTVTIKLHCVVQNEWQF